MALVRFRAVLISARCENAWGKLPSWRLAAGSYSSASSPTSFRSDNNLTNSFRASSRPTLWFTEGRRQATERMWLKYGAELNHPFPTDDVRISARPAPAALPVAARDGCMYFVKDDSRRLVCCNAPATKENRAGFRYCDDHAHIAVQAMKQKGGDMALRKYVPGT